MKEQEKLEVEIEVNKEILFDELQNARVSVGTVARFSSRFGYFKSVNEKLENIKLQIDEVLAEVKK